MTYNLAQSLDVARFNSRVALLKERGSVVELTEKVFRTSSQNRYLHSIIGVVAMETGVDLEYAKAEYFKRLCNPALFVRTVDDPYVGKTSVLRSSSQLNKEEMSEAIDRFKRWAAEQGIYLPEPEDTARLQDIEIELARLRRYL